MSNYKDHLILNSCKIKQALLKLNLLASDSILFVVDDQNKLTGSLTDGDVRRGLIKGYNLKSSVKKVLNTKPITSKIHVDKNEAENILRKNDLIHLPLIEKKKLLRL